MKKVFQTILIAASVFFTACKNPETGTEKSKVDTITTATTENKSSMPDYDPALDPWNVEAPFGKKFGDTLGIKMFEVTLKPGDTVPLHRHPDYTLYVVQGGKIAITTEGKGRQEIDLPTGAGLVNPTTTHSGKNIGKTTIRLLVTDIHR
ncbi:MAG: cupin domain-containing protein, partial [Ferruginibacter sp.]